MSGTVFGLLASILHFSSMFVTIFRQPWNSYRSDAQSLIDQSNRDIETVKLRPTSRTLRANVDAYSLETVRSPALMWISKPGVAPLSRAYPRLDECRPFRTLASRPNSKITLSPRRRDQKEEE